MIATVERTRKSKIYQSKVLHEYRELENDIIDDDDSDDEHLLALAKSRRNGKNRDFTSVDEFINFLENEN